MIRNIINLKAIILYFGLILCLIAGMPTPAYGSSSYPVKEESYVLVINSYVDGGGVHSPDRSYKRDVG